jgi:hypothetical protein
MKDPVGMSSNKYVEGIGARNDLKGARNSGQFLEASIFGQVQRRSLLPQNAVPALPQVLDIGAAQPRLFVG